MGTLGPSYSESFNGERRNRSFYGIGQMAGRYVIAQNQCIFLLLTNFYLQFGR